ncbi:sugar ABC transporter ATP-binding protein [Nocardioides sp.]|uniref:sugar ABC transporter ATP-binding protein n=1 Tax=Nocardioides sp. TaxID=35761 RepID=UPI00263580B3|nr:sugar ABC transporter ATP-binding protein [Nocardioides sp.]MDI6909045.1 sugar ABC transporter ATP-binding protein [Nocardioides sp.]
MTDEPGTDGDVILRAVDIVQTYGVTRALKGVNFEVRRGKVTVLFGENGAGKSTLMKIMSGVEQPTSGHLELDGEVVELESTTHAVDLGISIIHQELNLCPNLNVRDNMFVGRELRTVRGSVDFAAERAVAREVMERLEGAIDPLTLVANLRLGQQQVVEIARALSTKARILIMDEPTSALSAAEVAVLFRVIRELTAQGVAIVYISHHLEEAIEIADYAVVFRDGELVASEDAANISPSWVISKMVGKEAEHDFSGHPREHGDVILELENLRVVDPNSGRVAVQDMNLQLKTGEIVCLYGPMGAGRTELLEALAGRQPIASGKVLLNGTDITGRSIKDRIATGIGLVPEDRQRDGLVQMMTVGKNLSLPSLLSFVKRAFVSRSSEAKDIDWAIKEVRVKTSGPGAPITSLSGGNQQKVVIGKMLMTKPQVLLLDEPTRGIDVGAKAEVFSLLFKAAESGLAVLYATSEIGEAMTSSHRVIVMNRGRVMREFDPLHAERDEVTAASDQLDPQALDSGVVQ